MANSHSNCAEKALERFHKKLRQITRRLGLSHAEVAENTGIDIRTVDRHFQGQRPLTEHFCAYLEYYGCELVGEFLAPFGMAAIELETGVVCPKKYASQLAETLKVVIKALEDGTIDHLEQAEIVLLSDELHIITGKIKHGGIR